MKKFQFVGLGALVAAAAAVPYFINKKRQRRVEEGMMDSQAPTPALPSHHTDFKDQDHLIFCDESQLGRRLIQLEKTINMRDIGGYTGYDNRRTQWGKVIRSEELAHLSDTDVEYLNDLGVKHVYDFRDEGKAKRTPDRLPDSADYTNLPTLKGIPFSHHELDFTQPDAIDGFMRKIYTYQVENKAPEFAKVLKMLATEGETPILYHCTNGKDRTGFITALILLICGVPEETILSDYTLSNLTFDEAFQTLGSIMADELEDERDDFDKNQIRDFFGVKPEWLKIQLDYIKENYGDVDTYLLDKTDLTSDDLEQIRMVMLEPKT
ncbi:MAG: tyrosine-protein phosphatase [Eubacterium aggregans]